MYHYAVVYKDNYKFLDTPVDKCGPVSHPLEQSRLVTALTNRQSGRREMMEPGEYLEGKLCDFPGLAIKSHATSSLLSWIPELRKKKFRYPLPAMLGGRPSHVEKPPVCAPLNSSQLSPAFK